MKAAKPKEAAYPLLQILVRFCRSLSASADPYASKMVTHTVRKTSITPKDRLRVVAEVPGRHNGQDALIRYPWRMYAVTTLQ